MGTGWEPDADLRLASDAARGDHDAIRHLVRTLAPRFARMASSRARRSADAEDLASVALARVVEPDVLRHYQGTGPLTAYLSVVGERAMIAVCRTRRWRATQDVDLRDPNDPVDTFPRWPPAPSAESAMLATHIDHRLVEALAGLPARAEQIVRLKASGMTDAEIATALGEPVGTVKSTYHRARQQLRRRVDSGRADE